MNKKLFSNLAIGSFAAAGLVAAGSANAALIDLAFSLDESGSVGPTNFTTIILPGLADALMDVPIGGADQYRVTVVGFSDTARTIVDPTIIDSMTTLNSVKNLITNAGYNGGLTCISCSTDLLTTLINNDGGLGDTSFINITTDGTPNGGITDGTTLRQNLEADGWDSISAEAIGSFDTGYLLELVSPNPGVLINDPADIPDPLVQGFVFEVATFEDYAPAIDAKVEQIVVDTPEPTSLLGLGLIGGLGFLAKRQKS